MTNKNCLACASWKLKTSSMAESGLASCVNGKSYEFLPPHGRCDKWAPMPEDQVKARVVYFARIDGKRTSGKVST